MSLEVIIDMYPRPSHLDPPLGVPHCEMEAIKNAIGLGSSQLQSGKEPASGHTGSGTVSEPYDAGNTAGKPRSLSS